MNVSPHHYVSSWSRWQREHHLILQGEPGPQHPGGQLVTLGAVGTRRRRTDGREGQAAVLEGTPLL